MVNFSPSPVAQHVPIENPQLQQNLVQQKGPNFIQQQGFQAMPQNRFNLVRQPNLGELIVQQAQPAFHQIAQPNLGQQIVQQAQPAFLHVAQPVPNVAEVGQIRPLNVVDLEHVVKHYTRLIPNDDMLRSSGVHLLRDNNHPDGVLLGQVLASYRPVSHAY